jgi:hypothetical protein
MEAIETAEKADVSLATNSARLHGGKTAMVMESLVNVGGRGAQ